MSYTIDVYRGEAKAMKNFTDFSCFVSMFPHLVAGPILKFSYLANQLENRTLSFEKFARGATFVALGLAKKILLANPAGKVADTTFNAGSVGFLDAWFGAVAYAFQIYFDFSAYSDMAIGLGLMLGFVFAKNFDSPYKAASITEFWHRWHISLSSWLRDYLVHPARRQPPWTPSNVWQPYACDAARRPLAWGIMEFCHLGRDPWRYACLRTQPGEAWHVQSIAASRADFPDVPDCGVRLGLFPRQGPARRARLLPKHARLWGRLKPALD